MLGFWAVAGGPATTQVPAGPAAGDWPQLLGPQRNGQVQRMALARRWPESGPPIRWRKAVGQGFSGPVVVGQRVILFHRRGDEEIVEAIDADTGETRWSTSSPSSYRDDFGFDEGPRATPTVWDDRVFTFGAQGVLQGLDLATGRRHWSVDTHRRFDVRKGFFGAAASPLVHEGRVMVNVGGRDGAGIVAFDASTGDVLWTATNHEASYSAPVVATFDGQQRALFFTRNGLVDLDPSSGHVRAEFPWQSRSRSSVNAATPLVVGERIFLSASYGTGAVLLDVGPNGLTPVWSSDDALTNHYATSVRRGDYLYGYHGRQEYRPSLRAVEVATGKVAWSEDRFGGGTLLLNGDRLLVLRENGELMLVDASPRAFRPRARAHILEGTVRAYPAVAQGLLFARNEHQLVAVDLRPR